MVYNLSRVIVAVCLWLVASALHAHEGRPLYIEATELVAQSESEFRVRLRWKIPPILSMQSYPIITMDADSCIAETETPLPSLRGYADYRCSVGNASHVDRQTPLQIEIRYPQGNPLLSILLRYRQLKGQEFTSFSSPDTRAVPLPVNLGVVEVLGQYLSEGVGHILEGYDHLLFVFCLMVIAGTAKRIVWAVTGFTVAHSITLVLATNKLISLRIDLVEMLIALSIVFLAAEAVSGLKRGRVATITWRYPMLTSTGFGLLHGLGFASALAELGLPANMQFVALLVFNLGVEFGQLLFIAVALLSWSMLSRLFQFKARVKHLPIGQEQGFRPPVMLLNFVAVIASYWFVERLFAVSAT